MSKYLVNVSETYRINSETEVARFIDAAKNDNTYELKKYNCEYKEQKSKGEVIDSWYKVTLVKAFNEEKEPTDIIEIKYEREGGQFYGAEF